MNRNSPSLKESLPTLISVAATQITLPGSLVLLAGTWALFHWQQLLPPQSLLPLLAALAWLALGVLSLLGLAAGILACALAKHWRGTCATCALLNGLILSGMIAVCGWSMF